MITTEAIGSGKTEIVSLDGREIGYVTGDMMWVGEKASAYKFVSREAAIEACASAAIRGYWMGEVS